MVFPVLTAENIRTKLFKRGKTLYSALYGKVPFQLHIAGGKPFNESDRDSYLAKPISFNHDCTY